MTADLALATSAATASLAEKVEYAKAIAPADLLPPAFRGKAANVLLAMEAGQSLGKTAVEVMQNAHVISGKLGFSAEFQRALVLEAGHRIRVYMDGADAVATGCRSDDPQYQPEIRWTWAMAVEAKLTTGPNKDNWAKWPRNMLKARATTDLCRDLFPDVIRGYRSVTELQDMAVPAQVTTLQPGDRLRAAVGLPVAPADEIHDADVIELPEPEEYREITKAQLVKMHACFTDRKYSRDQGLAFIAQILGFQVESSKTLSVEEASFVIDALETGVEPNEA